ncbi:MAG: hypothetical protein KAT49_03765 [Methanomicrobia archaeon]|nr:hypothetical protein [Methanomicrobia archaeon]MCK4636980.1 hypothetical protein [Methanomicrobia archaeon]
MELIPAVILLTGPILIFGISSFFIYTLRQKISDIGYNLHWGALLYLFPLVVIYEAQYRLPFYIFFISSITLVVTLRSYTMDYDQKPFPKFLHRLKLKDWGDLCFKNGLWNFLMGLILSILFNFNIL